ncbi:hypothetical protein N826_31435 [Skermanella aerolata KACC 11604]|nr:hypothetical protein N826_31435 [Skermanella aerolata KACC 11604]
MMMLWVPKPSETQQTIWIDAMRHGTPTIMVGL